MTDLCEILYHTSVRELSVGAVLQAGDDADRPHLTFFASAPPQELVEVRDFSARRQAEQIFEQIRQVEYPDRPSRKVAFFANRTLEDARFWATKQARDGARIYRVKAVESATVFSPSLNWFNYAVRMGNGVAAPSALRLSLDGTIQAETLECARHYWRGESFEPLGIPDRFEVLIDGSVAIEELIE